MYKYIHVELYMNKNFLQVPKSIETILYACTVHKTTVYA